MRRWRWPLTRQSAFGHQSTFRRPSTTRLDEQTRRLSPGGDAVAGAPRNRVDAKTISPVSLFSRFSTAKSGSLGQ